MSSLDLLHGRLELPAFLPDATHGVVRALDATDLEAVGVSALMMNAFHLMRRPGSTTVRSLGGLHRMSGWERPVVTDSGGFQAYSLLRQDPSAGTLGDDGIAVRQDRGSRRFRLTPEKSVRLQLGYGADVITCLDDCTHPDDPHERQALSVKRTIEWAARSRAELDRLVVQKRLDEPSRPRLFAVVQGGTSRELRERCAAELLALGFDGFGYGGFPLDSEGSLLVEWLELVRELIPSELPMHALGVGHPAGVATCVRLGYALCDSALPTRDARRGRLYAFTQDPRELVPDRSGDWFAFRYIGDDRYLRDGAPVSEACDALCCRRYSRAYIHHLHAIRDGLFARLATLHNLRFMMQLVERLRVTAPSGA